MFLGGRFLTGFGCTAANTAAKSYVAEITSPISRGRWMGVLNSFYYGKYWIIATNVLMLTYRSRAGGKLSLLLNDLKLTFADSSIGYLDSFRQSQWRHRLARTNVPTMRTGWH
jgi:MFS family permease